MRRTGHHALRNSGVAGFLMLLLFSSPPSERVHGQEPPPNVRIAQEREEVLKWQRREIQARNAPEAFLQAAGVSSDPAQLTAFLTPRAAAQANERRIQDLIAQLGSEDFQTRADAQRELVLIGVPALDAVRAATRSEDAEVAARARQCSAEINEQQAVVVAALCALLKKEPKAVLPFLKSRNPHVKDILVQELGELKADANWAVPALLEALDDENKPIHYHTRRTLAVALAPKDFPLVVAAAKSERVAMRAGALSLFNYFPDQGSVCVPLLLEALHDKDPLVRRAAAITLGTFPSKKVVDALVEALADDTDSYAPKLEWSVAQSAAWGLFGCEKEAGPAIPALVRTLKNEKARKETRLHVAGVLGRIGGRNKALAPEVTAGLAETLQSAKDAQLRAASLFGLALIGPTAKGAAPQILTVLREMPPGTSDPQCFP